MRERKRDTEREREGGSLKENTNLTSAERRNCTCTNLITDLHKLP